MTKGAESDFKTSRPTQVSNSGIVQDRPLVAPKIGLEKSDGLEIL